MKKLFLSAAVVVILFLGALQARADLVPPSCHPGANASVAIVLPSTPGPVAVGTTIGYQVVINNPSADGFGRANCRITNAFVNLRLPDGVIIPILTNIFLDPGESILCPGVTNCLSTDRMGTVYGFIGYTNLVSLAETTNLDITSPVCPFPPGPQPAVTAYILGGTVVLNNPNPIATGTATYNSCTAADVNLPCISCFETCTNAIGESGSISFGGAITNCGDSPLVIITVSNLIGGGLLVPVTLSTNLLLSGQAATYSGSYFPPNPCLPTTYTILVRAFDLQTGEMVSNWCVATCPVCPALNLGLISHAAVITWSNLAFSLQAAPTVTGPYTNIPSAQSPYTDSVAGPQMFYRLINR